MTVKSLISVHRLRYFRFCDVLHIWTIRAIPTYRVYRLYNRRLVYVVGYPAVLLLLDNLLRQDAKTSKEVVESITHDRYKII